MVDSPAISRVADIDGRTDLRGSDNTECLSTRVSSGGKAGGAFLVGGKSEVLGGTHWNPGLKSERSQVSSCGFCSLIFAICAASTAV